MVEIIRLKVLHINCNYLCTTLHQLMVEKLDSLGIENTVFVPIYDGIVKAIKPNSNVIVSNCFKKWDRLIFQYKQKKILKAIKKEKEEEERKRKEKDDLNYRLCFRCDFDFHSNMLLDKKSRWASISYLPCFFNMVN